MSDSFVPPGVNYFPDVDKAVAKYPFDVRRSEQLMDEAGLWDEQPGAPAGETKAFPKLSFDDLDRMSSQAPPPPPHVV